MYMVFIQQETENRYRANYTDKVTKWSQSAPTCEDAIKAALKFLVRVSKEEANVSNIAFWFDFLRVD